MPLKRNIKGAVVYYYNKIDFTNGVVYIYDSVMEKELYATFSLLSLVNLLRVGQARFMAIGHRHDGDLGLNIITLY